MPATVYREQVRGGHEFVVETTLQEQVFSSNPIWAEDDFLGAGYAAAVPATATFGNLWVKKIVGTAPPTVAGDASSPNGTVTLAATSTAEKQEALLYWGDNRGLVMNQGLVVECRARVAVLPTLGTEMVIGVAGAWADGPDTIANSAYFYLTGTNGGLVSARVSDGGTVTAASAGVTVAPAEWHIYRIELFDLGGASGGIQFFIDGNPVAAGTTFTFGGNSAAGLVQPWLDVYKASGAGVGTLTLDFIRWQQKRQ